MSKSAFLAALVDSLLPGGPANLPSASSVGCDQILAHRSERLDALIAKIAHKAGGTDAFVTATSSVRAEILLALQAEVSEGFAELVTLTMSHYCAQAEVLKAIRWRAEPPQPKGHPLSPFDERLLAPVRARGPIWRKV